MPCDSCQIASFDAVVALVMELVGESRDAIADEYHRSEVHGMSEAGLKDIKMRMGSLPTDPAVYGAAPRALILRLLEYIDAKHGSVSQYLSSIGFDLADQRGLVNVFSGRT